jgi:RNA polymerase sigma factor (sigma-70 family)
MQYASLAGVIKDVSAETQKKRIAGFIATEWNRMVGAVRAWISDTAERDAEDVVQDVFERMFEKADLSEPIADLSAYVYRSLRNRVIDLYRRKRPAAADLEENLTDLRFGATGELDRDEAREELFDAIDELPAAQREVLVATELEGRSFKELSEEWHTPLGTLLARKHRAIRSLRESLTGGME